MANNAQADAAHHDLDDHPHGLRRWLFSTNHNDIGTLYLILSLVGGVIGALLSMAMRAELMEPGMQIFGNPEMYNVFVTAHGLIMVFFSIMPATVGAFGICPFVSRGTAIGMDMYETLKTIKEMYAELERPPKIIAVSLKGIGEVELALKAGVDVVGMRYPLVREMMEHPLSQKAELLFAKNWTKVKGEDLEYMRHAMGMEGTAEDSVH